MRQGPSRALVIPLVCLAVAVEAAEDPRVAPALAQARAAAVSLSTELRELLQKEMAAGGVKAGVQVCATVAQEKTRAFREREGRDVRRVSLRNRSLLNVPDEYERQVLESFDRLDPEKRASAESYEVVRVGEKEVLRYLRPIVTAQTCLGCHGDPAKIDPAVKALLAESYPDDKATGFAVGDVRGAVSVRIPLEAGH